MRFRSRASILVFALALLVVVLPSCRTWTKKKPVAPTTPAVTEPAPPEVPMTVTTDPTDFVATPPPPEPIVITEPLSGDLGVATDQAHQRGWIRDVFFDFDSFALTPDGQEALAVSASWLKSHPEYGLLIEGHCDERGTEQYNLALGDRRANIAREYLATLGVEDGRMKTLSYGEERPFATGSHEEAWRQNRRARFVLVRP